MQTKQVVVKGDALGDCPFCGGEIAFSRDEGGTPDGMVHSIPMCEKFETMDALTFARAVRVEYRRRLG